MIDRYRSYAADNPLAVWHAQIGLIVLGFVLLALPDIDNPSFPAVSIFGMFVGFAVASIILVRRFSPERCRLQPVSAGQMSSAGALALQLAIAGIIGTSLYIFTLSHPDFFAEYQLLPAIISICWIPGLFAIPLGLSTISTLPGKIALILSSVWLAGSIIILMVQALSPFPRSV